jgi:hypothetical protein
MSVQTSVAFDFDLGYPGDIVGNLISQENKVAQVDINPGLFVCQGSADGKVKLPTSSAEVAKGIGIALSAVHRDPNFPSSSASYPTGETVPIGRVGRYIVRVEEAVSPFDPVYVRYDTGSASQKGAFRASADSSTAALVTGAKYRTTAAADGLAVVEINLPQ